jgi:hypothetical protein
MGCANGRWLTTDNVAKSISYKDYCDSALTVLQGADSRV